MDKLPVDYDAIVVGTGMTGSIVAAALSRVGKLVLHIDENEFYGEEWSSFNLDTIKTWQQSFNPNASTHDIDVNKFVNEGERYVKTQRYPRCSNIKQEWFAKDVEAEDDQKESNMNTMDGGGEVEEGRDVVKKPVDWTKSGLVKEYRKFNIDLCPKMLYSRGLLVELLISSNIARYADFKSVSRVLTWREGALETVPCSRADVFATKHINVVQKRMLVKVLTVLAEFHIINSSSEFEGFEDKTFLEYLKTKKLSEQVMHYILYAIAMGSDKMPCIEGVMACQRFLLSLGRYGNTPFIFPLYGSGELPQCFCRLCAVFGGVYHLKRRVDGYILNSSNEAVAIVSGEQRLNTKLLVISSSVCPKEFMAPCDKRKIGRGIFLTNRSMLVSEKEALTLLQFPPAEDIDSPVTIMEMGGACQVCPPGLFLVHMTTEASNALDAVDKVRNLLFLKEEEDSPSVLWSLTWEMSPGSDDVSTECPKNVRIFSGPDASLDFDGEVLEAKKIFSELCPDEEFLPRAPDPDEVILSSEEPADEVVADENEAEKHEIEDSLETGEEAVESTPEGASIASD